MSTVRDVAKLAGVSVATVSRVINTSELVKPATKLKVEAAMLQLNFTPNQMARALATNRSGVIAILIDFVDGGYFGKLLDAIEQCARKKGFQTIISCGNSMASDVFQSLKNLSGGQCDALIACVPFMSDGELNSVLMQQKNTVFMNCASRGHADRSIIVDNELGVRMALDHLLAKGHTQIALMTGPEENVESRERLIAAKQWFAEKNLPLPELHIVTGRFKAEPSRQAMHQLLKQAPEISALFCFNDQMALGAMTYLHQQRVSLPERLSIIGFDDIEACSFSFPALTSVSPPLREMADRAIAMIERMLAGDALPPLAPMVPSMAIRESVITRG